MVISAHKLSCHSLVKIVPFAFHSDKFLAAADRIAARYRRGITLLLSIWTILVLYFILPNRGMSPAWTVPYFSGSANLEAGMGWRFLPSEVDSLKQANGFEYYLYRFKRGNEQALRTYHYNSSGYVYVIHFSQWLFPFVNEAGSVVILQLLLHFIICVALLRHLNSQISRFVFSLIYACNPLILYIVTMPFYYFLPSLSSFLLLYFFLKKRPGLLITILLLLAGCFFPYCRKTIFPLELLISGLFLYRRHYFPAVVNLVFLLLFPVFIKKAGGISDPKTGPWHSVLIGVGAYPNPYEFLNKLSDNTGMDLYRKEKDPTLSSSMEGKFVFDPAVQNAYLSFVREKYFSILREHPILLIRNACLNFFQGYSVGHVSNFSFLLNIIISLSGAGILLFLFWRKAYFYLVAIGFSHIAFTPFYPPIPAYMFGSYLLLGFAICQIFLEKKPIL